MIFTFFKAAGLQVGNSLVEEDQLALAKRVQADAKALGVEFILPVDVVLADKFAEDANSKITEVESIPEGWMVSMSILKLAQQASIGQLQPSSKAV